MHYRSCKERKKIAILTPKKSVRGTNAVLHEEDKKKSDIEVPDAICEFAKSMEGGECKRKTVVAYRTHIKRMM